MTESRHPLRIGIAGLGRLGRRHALNLARHVPGAELRRACSADEQDRAFANETLGIPRFDTDFEALLHDPHLDAIVLATPTALHADQVIAVLNAGKHVFVEKPLALDIEACERVQAVGQQHPKQIAMVGFVRRFDTSYQHAQQQLASGALGRPFLVRSQTCDRNDPSGFFVNYAGQSGGIFMDCSVHDIDLARWFLGNPKATRAFASGTIASHAGLRQYQDVDNGLAIVEFQDGSRAVFYASRTFAHGHETQTEIIATEGKLLIGHGAARDRVVTSDAQGVRYQSTTDFYERFSDAFLQEMQHFVGACRGDHPPALTLADASEATRIGLAITQSLHSGNPVDI
ncbi:Gfo/Idh/MocA family oxidoreductase [Castellaniella sp.]|uniref:Gfo/Idh/MocA family oxidoreductase n=1 Tax=Castellaniella sp. TaxID=1955812 RepID=UPI002AFFCA47|nr:Gfo/Idh/MocA family oxidoreductase [Castellaniella sp.]